MKPDPTNRRSPGLWWVAALGAVGFLAGFVGPMVFLPDSNLGPIVGILFTSPGGVAVGGAMFLVTRVVRLSATVQWRLLAGIALIGTVGILLYVQPEPATRGYVLELELKGTRSPLQATEPVVADWRERIAKVTWAKPTDGWESAMRATLANDSGTVIDGVLLRRRPILVKRKPWNRGELFALDWEPSDKSQSYYVRPNQLPDLKAVSRLELFLPLDEGTRIRPPEVWPPKEFEQVIGLSRVEPIPPVYAAFR